MNLDFRLSRFVDMKRITGLPRILRPSSNLSIEWGFKIQIGIKNFAEKLKSIKPI